MDRQDLPPVSPNSHKPANSLQVLLLISVFTISTCGLIYELIAGTLASYLLGDSVTQFSTIIGAYLFSMGIGSWLSKYIEGDLLKWFIRVEILVGLIGGLSAPLLFFLFEYALSFRMVLYGIVGITGILVGLEIPLLMRILQSSVSFKDLVSRVFTFDYIGALLAALIFPLVLVPYLGLIRSSLFFGMLNIGVAYLLLSRFEQRVPYRKPFTIAILCSVAFLLSAFVYSERIMSFTENQAFEDKVIYSRSTPYQRIVLTRNSRELRLFLNGNLQFSSADEYRYHEALVHPAMQAFEGPVNVLILGGGDGLAVRELLRYPNIKSITLVDLDPAMTTLFRTNRMLRSLNQGSLSSPKVKVINADAFNWLKNSREKFQLIIADFPDPSNYSIGKLYSKELYREVYRCTDSNGIAVVQSTSPFVARKSFWCIAHTASAAGFHILPYHAYVPSFGEWGYVMATKNFSWRNNTGRLASGLRFVSEATINDMMYFPKDMSEIPTETNRLNNQVLVHYFDEEWSPYVH